MAERNELQNLRKELEQWKENILEENKKAFSELASAFEVQSEKLKQIATDECQWQLKYCELQSLNNCLTEKVKTLKCNIADLQSKLTESEQNRKRLENELCSAKVSANFLFARRPRSFEYAPSFSAG